MRIKWLHLSDIHFNYKNFDSHELREDFLERIKLLCQNEPFTHLFLTGDILFRNEQSDAETAAFINELITTLQLPIENVIIVPGNHDHNRDAVISQLAALPDNEDTTIDSLDQSCITPLLAAFEKFDAVYKEIFSSSYYTEYSNPHSILVSDSMTVIKLNTAWLDTDSSEDPSLRIGSRQLQHLLSNAKADLQKTVNIAVGHHPLHELSSAERSRVLKLFQKHNIGVYFCGHSHQANICVHRDYDVVEIIAPGGFIDDAKYSVGGYVWGILDSDTNFYKAEIFNWRNNKWCIDSTIPETNDHGIYYFNTSHFTNSTDIVAVDCKTMNGRLPKKQLDHSLGCNSYDIHTYCGPYGNPSGYSIETIREFSDTILQLSEAGKSVHLYPLAPIPMLISLGFNLQKNSKLFIHQHDRQTDRWVYNECSDQISVTHTSRFATNDTLVVSISTSFEISPESISAAMAGQSYDFLEFKSNRIEAGYPLYNADVCSIVQTIIHVLNSLASKYSSIHLFAAIPAGMAVELGRNFLTSVYKNIYTYQFTQGQYKQDLIINEVLPPEEHMRTAPSFTLDPSSIVYIPILGRVPCGPIKEAITEDDKCFPLPESILDNGNYFMLEASGDSMIGAGIDEGDYILVKQQNTANEGEIVVAIVDGNTTIKRIHYDDANQQYVLCPENPRYTKQTFGHLDIQGIAVKIIKNL